MKLCVFGADGRTGVEVVRYATQRGFDVVTCVYGSTPPGFFPENVTVKEVNIMEYESVKDALMGVSTVISVVGHIRGSHPRMQTLGMKNIVTAMKELGVKRVLSLTGTGVRVEGDTPSRTDKLLNVLVERIDPDRILDGREHVDVITHSELDWTVVRVLKLSESRGDIQGYRLTSGGPAELLTSRKKVAQVLVDLIGVPSSFGTLPVVSG